MITVPKKLIKFNFKIWKKQSITNSLLTNKKKEKLEKQNFFNKTNSCKYKK